LRHKVADVNGPVHYIDFGGSGPTLLMVHGLPCAAARELVRKRPDWELEIIEGVGHVPMLETPELFMRALEGWNPYRIPSQPAAVS